jgi:hypothetical protein
VVAEAAGKGVKQLAARAEARLKPVEALEEALRAADEEPLEAVELALQALKSLKRTFEISSFESALKAHKARIRLEERGLK